MYFCCFLNPLSTVFGVDKVHPKLKRRYHAHSKKVKEYLSTFKDFNELISPNLYFSIFLVPTFQQSSKEYRNRQEKYVDPLSFNFYYTLFRFAKDHRPFFSFLGMKTRFSKSKLTKAQETKAKASLIGGLLLMKCQRESESPKDNAVVTSSVAKSQDHSPASPTSSLELIVSQAKAISNTSIASF